MEQQVPSLNHTHDLKTFASYGTRKRGYQFIQAFGHSGIWWDMMLCGLWSSNRQGARRPPPHALKWHRLSTISLSVHETEVWGWPRGGVDSPTHRLEDEDRRCRIIYASPDSKLSPLQHSIPLFADPLNPGEFKYNDFMPNHSSLKDFVQSLSSDEEV
jgi:hypothetical protein